MKVGKLMLDIFGKNASELKNKKLFLFDMDGTIYEENRLINGTLDFLSYIKCIKGEYVFITNNSSKSLGDYIVKLADMGIEVEMENFFTSSQATALYLNDNYQNKKIFCMGTKSLIKELASFGIKVTEDKNDNVDVVVVGFDTELTFEKLYDTCDLVTRQLPFIATNIDRACPVSFGFIPDCGAICEMIYFATGRRPVFIGKPNPLMVNYVINNSKFSKEETLVIGDRLYTDIAVGINAGISTICVLTGETKLSDLKDSDVQPDFIFESVNEVVEGLKYTY
jgi:HAD superfamily hydrolase (TIGR01457 family)